MIPKIIHYCWFGGNPLPESACKCIASWRKFFPDYEIKEWNEANYDVASIPYTADAYAAGKYAFVSDFVRFDILYKEGGLYFDTDVEVIRPMDDIIAAGPFMGFEKASIPGAANESDGLGVAPGLGLGVEPGNQIYRELIEAYHRLSFYNTDGSPNLTTIVKYTTNLLIEKGLVLNNKLQQVDGIYIYPNDYFNPLNDNTGKLDITDNTRSIHWYSKTWLNVSPWRIRLSRLAHRFLGNKLSKVGKLLFFRK